MKKLGIVTVAILIGLSGAAMAGYDSESQQGGASNSTGPNPFMPEFSTPVRHGDADITRGYSAFGQYPVHHHVVHHQVKK
jgi:hypothetical protein